MEATDEIQAFLHHHLQAIQENDVDTYHRTTAKELTLYEWWVTPHRIEGLPFHDFMMESHAAQGTVFGSETSQERADQATRYDLANLKIQVYGEAAVASYTLLISTRTPGGVTVSSHHESRVLIRTEHGWLVVHVHKSPAYQAPHSP